MRALYHRLKQRAFDHLAENDGWFAVACLAVIAIPVVGLLVY